MRVWRGPSVLVFTNIDFFGTFLAFSTDNVVYRNQNSKIKGSHLKIRWPKPKTKDRKLLLRLINRLIGGPLLLRLLFDIVVKLGLKKKFLKSI